MRDSLSAARGILLGVLIGAALWVLIILSANALASDGTHPITVRWCPEDAVHVGRGDFDGTRWDRYVCIARDDL